MAVTGYSGKLAGKKVKVSLIKPNNIIFLYK